jgi:DNA uptake protein ComE-like DNA-binding protein
MEFFIPLNTYYMARFFRKVKDFLIFSRSDRNAVITLGVLIIVVTGGNLFIKHMQMNTPVDHSEFEKLMNAWNTRQRDKDSVSKNIFKFNPNEISEELLDSLSLPSKVKQNLLKYRSAGGRFIKAEDFRKIYGMNDSLYALVKDYISIEDIEGDSLNLEIWYTGTYSTGITERNGDSGCRLQIELNSADSVKLLELNGIGKVFASRIVKYRNLLGGFYNDSQLLEVYNFQEETLNNIRPYIIIDSTAIKKIRINFAGFSELIRHPYLSKDEVIKILEYREENGLFLSVGQFGDIILSDSLKLKKIKPYLTCR